MNTTLPLQGSQLLERFQALDHFLLQHQPLWRPRPFTELQLGWESEYSELSAWLRNRTLEQAEAVQQHPEQVPAPAPFPQLASLARQLSAVGELPDAGLHPAGRRSLPHVNDWARRYADQGLVVVGVHTPEYDYEHDVASLREQVNRLGIGYPVAVDNGYRIWNAWGNQFWPAHYFVDRKGQVRHVHFGEGDYDGQERVIRQLLDERG